MDNEFTPDLITLIDEEGNEHSFEILDKIIEDDKEYLALYPVFDSAEDSVNDSGEYYIMEVILSDDGEEELAELDDEDLLDRLAQQFEERFASMFDDQDEE